MKTQLVCLTSYTASVLIVLGSADIAENLNCATEKESRVRCARIQIPFVANEGQIPDSDVAFYANTFGGTVSVLSDVDLPPNPQPTPSTAAFSLTTPACPV